MSEETTAADENDVTEGEMRVLEWRAETLERAGLDRVRADVIAAADHVDLHAAVNLVRRGCNPDLALRILL